MVTTRKGGSNATLLKEKVNDYFLLYGTSSVTLIKKTETRNAAGRISSITETQSTITGDLQFNNKLLRDYIALGVALSGDAMFFCKGAENVTPHDHIVVDSVRWELIKQIEGETVEDTVIYRGFIARRIPDA